MNHHGAKGVNQSTEKLVNIWDKDINKKDCLLNFDEFGNQEHKNLYPFFTIEKNNFANEFNKEVLACVLNTQLLNANFICKEAKEKAKKYLSIEGFAVGGYSESRGVLSIRINLVNNFYKKRDGDPKITENEIYLVNGSMNAYDHAVNLVCNQGETVILPNPCYKLYINFNHSFRLKNMFYDIDFHKWTVNFDELEKNIVDARQKGEVVKAIIAINPNFPLGFICSERQLLNFIKFCERHNLVLIAVEGLQNTIINRSKKFYSMRSIVSKLNSKLEVISLNSISYGHFFHGGMQAGVLDTMNISPSVSSQLYKYKSVDLCSNVPGQILIDLCLNKSEDFGEEFMKKYEAGLHQNMDKLIRMKDCLIQDLQKDGKFDFRDIDAGNSIFVRNKFPNEKVLVNGKNIRYLEGHYYGEGFEDYINLYI